MGHAKMLLEYRHNISSLIDFGNIFFDFNFIFPSNTDLEFGDQVAKYSLCIRLPHIWKSLSWLL